MRHALSRAMNAATAATPGHACAQLWNPHATKALRVLEIHVMSTAATAANPAIRRSSARGTAGASTTSAAENAFQDPGTAADSGAILDVAAFSVQPTLVGSNAFFSSAFPAAIGSGVMWVEDRPIEIGPGRGLVIVTFTGIAFPISQITYVWDDG